MPDGFRQSDSYPSGSARYSQGELGPLIVQSIDSVEDASGAFAPGNQSFESRASQPWTELDDEGAETTYTPAPLSLPTMGDKQAA